MTGCQLAVDSHRRVSETCTKKEKKKKDTVSKQKEGSEMNTGYENMYV